MATPKIDKDLCRFITPEFRVSYPHVFSAQAPKPTDKLKFSIVMLFPKKLGIVGLAPDKVTPRKLAEVLRTAKEAKFGPKENWPEDLLSPVVDGDKPKYADKEGYAGHWVIKASSNEDQRPSVVDKFGKPLMDARELYPGCYARAAIYAYVYPVYMGKQGITLILDGVQKIRDGQPFGGKLPADQVFDPIVDDTASDEVSADGDF